MHFNLIYYMAGDYEFVIMTFMSSVTVKNICCKTTV